MEAGQITQHEGKRLGCDTTNQFGPRGVVVQSSGRNYYSASKCVDLVVFQEGYVAAGVANLYTSPEEVIVTFA